MIVNIVQHQICCRGGHERTVTTRDSRVLTGIVAVSCQFVKAHVRVAAGLTMSTPAHIRYFKVLKLCYLYTRL